MEFHPLLIQHLDTLSDGLDNPGTDLRAILSVLVDDLTEAIPSFLGLNLTLSVDGIPVMLTTMETAQSEAVRASLLLPLADIGAMNTECTVIFYAHTAGAFEELAAYTRRAFNLDGKVVVDRHLEHPNIGLPGITGLAEVEVINQAIGILIGRGSTPEEARDELRRCAAERLQTEYRVAQHIIDEIGC